MDFGNAVLLAFATFLTVTFAFALMPDSWENNRQARILTVIIVGQLITIVCANSDWGVKQVVDGIALKDMNAWSLGLVGLGIAGLAAVGNKLITFALPNMGQNLPAPPQDG